MRLQPPANAAERASPPGDVESVAEKLFREPYAYIERIKADEHSFRKKRHPFYHSCGASTERIQCLLVRFPPVIFIAACRVYATMTGGICDDGANFQDK